MEHSTHYQLHLPQPTDLAEIAPLSENFASLDALLFAQNEALLAHGRLADNPHQVTASQTGAYTKVEADAAMLACANERMSALGGGDMVSDIYDKDHDGMVDQSKDAQLHLADTDNPHLVSKAHVGLALADNTPDAQKHVLHAQSAGTIDGGVY